MTDAAKGVDHYLAHPEEIDSLSESDKARLLVEMGGAPLVTSNAEDGNPSSAPDPASSNPPGAAPASAPSAATAATPAAGTTGAASTTGNADGKQGKDGKDRGNASDGTPETSTAILAPDGKSTIPYSVLQRERQRASAAEGAVGSLTDQVSQLTERLKALEAGGKPATAAAADEISQEIEALRDEAPDVAKAFDKINAALNARFAALEERQNGLIKSQEETAEEQLARVKADVQVAIDANPALTHWRETNPDLYAEATAFDDTLRARPEWADRPFAERFDKVVSLVVAMHDASVLPPGHGSTPTPRGGSPNAATGAVTRIEGSPQALSPQQIKAQALAKLAQNSPVPNTLTDIPGGTPAEQSEVERVDNLSVGQLGAKFMNMTPEQQQSYLANTFG